MQIWQLTKKTNLLSVSNAKKKKKKDLLSFVSPAPTLLMAACALYAALLAADTSSFCIAAQQPVAQSNAL